MAWSGLIRAWDGDTGRYKTLTLRIEDTQQPGWLAKLYDGETTVAEELAETPQQAVTKLLEVARRYLNDPSIDEASVDWIQL